MAKIAIMRTAAALLCAALLLTGCSDDPAPAKGDGLSFDSCGPLVDLGEVPAERLARVTVECATLTVPVEHADPDGKALDVQVVRARANDPVDRIGSLVLNPGGPGQSGLSFFPGWLATLPEQLLTRFDVVTFDPRGTGASAPISCKDLAPTEAEPLDDLTTSAGYAAAQDDREEHADACLAALGDRAPSFSTQETARDLDLLRQRLGDEKLSYVGFSYGAKLGGEYARQFPSRVRALVLDGPSDPQLPPAGVVELQTKGFEDALHRWAAGCGKRPTCTGLGDPVRYVTDLVAAARTQPIPSGRPGDDLPATDTDVLAGTLSLLYDDAAWPALDEALRDAAGGDSGGLLEAHEAANGGADGGVADASYVINCNDTAPGPTEAEVTAAATRLVSRYPVFGRYGAGTLTLCQQWQPDRHPVTVSAVRTAPLLVVGTVHDPATPYAGAVSFAKALGPATLLTWEGEGHTAFLRAPCIDQHVQAYLVSLTVPAAGTRCPA